MVPCDAFSAHTIRFQCLASEAGGDGMTPPALYLRWCLTASNNEAWGIACTHRLIVQNRAGKITPWLCPSRVRGLDSQCREATEVWETSSMSSRR